MSGTRNTSLNVSGVIRITEYGNKTQKGSANLSIFICAGNGLLHLAFSVLLQMRHLLRVNVKLVPRDIATFIYRI